MTRSGFFTDDYPQLMHSLKLLRAKSAIIDGEITALDDEGKSSFQLLQLYGIGKRTPLVYYAFDLLFFDGTDLRARPLIERRNLLSAFANAVRAFSIAGSPENLSSKTGVS